MLLNSQRELVKKRGQAKPRSALRQLATRILLFATAIASVMGSSSSQGSCYHDQCQQSRLGTPDLMSRVDTPL